MCCACVTLSLRLACCSQAAVMHGWAVNGSPPASWRKGWEHPPGHTPEHTSGDAPQHFHALENECGVSEVTQCGTRECQERRRHMQCWPFSRKQNVVALLMRAGCKFTEALGAQRQAGLGPGARTQ
eukprot:351548-Chlamydomonas_euryale.AAC.8